MRKGLNTAKAQATIGEKRRVRKIKAASNRRRSFKADRADDNKLTSLRNSVAIDRRTGIWKRFTNWIKSLWQK